MAEVYVSAVAGNQQRLLALTPMRSLFNAAAPYTYTPYTYPNDVTTAATAFADGHYAQHLDFHLTDVSDLRIGLRHFSPTVYDWACCDNFRLFFKGDLNAIGSVADDETANGKSTNGKCFDLSGRRVHAPQRGMYIMGGKKVVVK